MSSDRWVGAGDSAQMLVVDGELAGVLYFSRKQIPGMDGDDPVIHAPGLAWAPARPFNPIHTYLWAVEDPDEDDWTEAMDIVEAHWFGEGAE